MDKQGKTSMMANLLIAVVLGSLIVFGGLYFIGQRGTGGTQQTVAGGTALQQPLATTECRTQTDGTNTLNTVFRNTLDTTATSYGAASAVAVYDNGADATSATLTGGTSLTFTALNVEGQRTGNIYILSDTNFAGTETKFSSCKETSGYTINGANSSRLNMQQIRDTSLVAINSSDAGGDASINSTTQAMVAGDSLDLKLDIQVSGSATAFGYTTQNAAGDITLPSDGVIIAADIPTTKFSLGNGIVIQSEKAGVVLSPITCPAIVVAAKSTEACWQTRTLTASDGLTRLAITARADLGDPVAGDQLVVYAFDNAIIRNLNGKIEKVYFNSAANAIGAGDTNATIRFT